MIDDKENLRREWAKFGVATVLSDDKDTPNEYYIDGKQVSRVEAGVYILTKAGKTDFLKYIGR